MSKMIQLAKGLSLPADDLATQVTAALGMRGSGKSNVMAVIAEGLLDARIPIVVLDYVGIWASLRLRADGKTPSRFGDGAAMQITVLGGPHADIEILPTAGAAVGDALARASCAAVLDLSRFTTGQRQRFAGDFASAFFQRKKDFPSPVWLLLEEAQRFVPQRPQPDQAAMLGAFEEIVEVGRNYGVGVGMISQRPQAINKQALNLSDNVICHRLKGVHERKAVDEWVQEAGVEGREAVKGELPGLARGTAIVWCGGAERNIFGAFSFPKKSTYDAGATPTGARVAMRVEPMAANLDSLRALMRIAVHEAAENDPRTLRAEIERLRAQRPVTERVDVPTMPPGLAEAAKHLSTVIDESRLMELTQALTDEAKALLLAARAARHRLAQAESTAVRNVTTPAQRAHTAAEMTERVERAKDRRETFAAGEPMSLRARRVLHAIVSKPGAPPAVVATLSGYSVRSSSYEKAVAELRRADLIAGSALLEPTARGRQVAGPSIRPLPRGRELLVMWKAKTTLRASKMLQALADSGPLGPDELSERSGYSVKSSSYEKGIAELRRLELITGGGRDGGRFALAPVLTE